MAAITQAPTTATPLARNFSLAIGGPFYNLMKRLRPGARELPNIRRRAVAFVAVTWGPLVVLALAQGVAVGARVRVPLLYDYAVYARFLAGLPLLIMAEAAIDPALRRAICNFVDAGLVQEKEMPALDEVLEKAARLRDSRLAELAFLILAFVPMFLFVEQEEWLTDTISTWRSTAHHGLSLAGWWFAIVSTPLVRFILYRWMWRFFVWSALLWRVSRINLHLLATHPDSVGGLGFLPQAQQRFGILFTAAGAVLAGQFANGIAYQGESLTDCRFLMLGFVILALVIVFSPLLAFVPRLFELRRSGLVEYGRLANEHMESFERKWVGGGRKRDERPLGNADMSSQADLGSGYFVIQHMRIVPIDKQGVIEVAIEAAAPLLVVVLAVTPAEHAIRTILKMLF